MRQSPSPAGDRSCKARAENKDWPVTLLAAVFDVGDASRRKRYFAIFPSCLVVGRSGLNCNEMRTWRFKRSATSFSGYSAPAASGGHAARHYVSALPPPSWLILIAREPVAMLLLCRRDVRLFAKGNGPRICPSRSRFSCRREFPYSR